MIKSLFSKFGTLLNQWTAPPTPPDENIIKYWQDRLLFAVLLAGLVLGLIVYIPSVALCIKQRLWFVALALFRARSDGFDLVITDMTMPDMTGEKLASELMAIRADIPIILCTGYSRKISEEIAADMGIKALAYKPIKNVALAKVVRNVLDGEKIKGPGRV